MLFNHSPKSVSYTFDEPNLVSAAGLAPVMALAQNAGLAELGQETVTVFRTGTDKGAETAWWPTMTLTILWLGLYALILMQYPSPGLWLIALSGGYVLYYAALSLRLTLKRQSHPGGPARSAGATN